jgi:hypothetical protein
MRGIDDRVAIARHGDDDASWVSRCSTREMQERWEALLARVLEDDLEDEHSPAPRLTVIQGGCDV